MKASVCDSTSPLRPNTEPQGVPEALDRFFRQEIAHEGIGVRYYEILRHETLIRPNTEPQGVPEALDRFFR